MTDPSDLLGDLRQVVPKTLAKPGPRAWREGSDIVADNNAKLPPRCVLCDSTSGCSPVTLVCIPSDASIKTSTGVRMLALVSPIGVAYATRDEKVSATVYFCAADRRRRLLIIGTPVTLFLASLALIPYALIKGSDSYGNLGFALFLGGLAGFLFFGILALILRLRYAYWGLKLSAQKKIMRISGAAESFTESLPASPDEARAAAKS